MKRLVLVQERLNPVLAGRQVAQALDRVADRLRINGGVLFGLEAVDVDAKDLLGLGAFIDLEPRFFLIIRRQDDQQPSVERSLRELRAKAYLEHDLGAGG